VAKRHRAVARSSRKADGELRDRVINGLTLPRAFVEDTAIGRFKRARGSWQLRQECDAYSNPLETELGKVYATAEAIQEQTARLPRDFEPGNFYGTRSADNADGAPGFIPDITDFSWIVCFGISGDDAPFCFDFRDDPNHPSVVWWDDWYWRRIAPDYEAFVGLFDIG